MTYLIIGIVGLIIGLLVSKIFLLISTRQSVILYLVNAVLGILGAVAAEQLVKWGPTLLQIQVAPVLVGSIVLPIVGIYFFYLVKRFLINLRSK